MKKYSICFVMYRDYPFGSIDFFEYARNLAESSNFKVTFIVREKMNYNDTSKNLEVISIDYKKELSLLYFILKAIKKIRENQYDIVHVYSTRLSFLFPLLKKSKFTKYILDIRTGSLSGGIRTWLSNKRLIIESIFFDKITILDDNLRKKVFANFFKNKISLLPLGADVKGIKRSTRDMRSMLGFGEEDVVFIYHGKLSKQRKTMDIVHAMKLVISSNQQVKLMLLGIGDAEKEILKFIQDEGLEENIHFLGYIPYTNIHKYLKAADVGIAYIPITPEFDVQPPLKTVEYLAAGLPIIATSTRGNKNFVENGVNGIFINDSVTELAGAISLMKNRRSGNLAKGNELIENITNMFDWGYITEKYLMDLYIQLTDKKAY